MEQYAKRWTAGAKSYFGANNQMRDASTFAPDNASLEKELVQYLLAVSYCDHHCVHRRCAHTENC